MTAEEVADMLRVSPAYIRKLVRTGELPACRTPGLIRIRRDDALRLLNPAA